MSNGRFPFAIPPSYAGIGSVACIIACVLAATVAGNRNLAIMLGCVAALAFAVMAVRVQEEFRTDESGHPSTPTPSYATATCATCNTAVGPGDGQRIRGDTYCSDGCARWAW